MTLNSIFLDSSRKHTPPLTLTGSVSFVLSANLSPVFSHRIDFEARIHFVFLATVLPEDFVLTVLAGSLPSISYPCRFHGSLPIFSVQVSPTLRSVVDYYSISSCVFQKYFQTVSELNTQVDHFFKTSLSVRKWYVKASCSYLIYKFHY